MVSGKAPKRDSANHRPVTKQTPASLFCALLLTITTASAKPVPNFMQRDLDGNGRLTLKESQLSQTKFERLDESHNGELSLGEFGEYWRTQSSKPALADVAYGPHSRQHLTLYLPADHHRPLPLVLWIHGGTWQTGDKEPCPFKNLTERGFAVAAVNYRFITQSPFPACLDDCRAALAWLKEHPDTTGAKFSKTYATGLSAGGHLSLLLGAEGSVDGVVAFAAPSDLSQRSARDHFRETLEKLLGGSIEEHEEALKAASPRQVWKSPSTRLLLFQGLEDRKVPYTEATEMARTAQRAGSPVELRLLPDGSHTVVGGPEGWNLMLEFLKGDAR